MEPLTPSQVITKIELDTKIEMINEKLSGLGWKEGTLAKSFYVNIVLNKGEAEAIKRKFKKQGWSDMEFTANDNNSVMVSLCVTGECDG